MQNQSGVTEFETEYVQVPSVGKMKDKINNTGDAAEMIAKAVGVDDPDADPDDDEDYGYTGDEYRQWLKDVALWLGSSKIGDYLILRSPNERWHERWLIILGPDDMKGHHFTLFRTMQFNFDLIVPESTSGKVPVYYGLGARVKFKDDNGHHDDKAAFGIRVPLGIGYLFAEAPFDLFAEIAPILDLTPDTDLEINAAVGVRFYFK